MLYRFNFYRVQDIALKVCSVCLLFISIILFQSLIIDGNLSGKIGNILVDSLSPFVGLAGLWIFVIVGFVISFILLFDTDELFNINTSKFKETIVSSLKFSYPKNKIKSLPPKLSRSHEQKVTVKEVGDTAEIFIEEENKIQQPIFENPELLKHTHTL